MGGFGIVLFFILTLVALAWSLHNVEKAHRDAQDDADRRFARSHRAF